MISAKERIKHRRSKETERRKERKYQPNRTNSNFMKARIASKGKELNKGGRLQWGGNTDRQNIMLSLLYISVQARI